MKNTKEVWFFWNPSKKGENFLLPITGDRVNYRSSEGDLSFFSSVMMPTSSPSYNKLKTKGVK